MTTHDQLPPPGEVPEVPGTPGARSGAAVRAAAAGVADPFAAWDEVPAEPARRLLLSALESFAGRGFHATTTRHIATGAGMSPAALYIHYRSKAEVLAHISREGHAATLRVLREAVQRSTDPVERMRGLVHGFVSWHAEHHTVARVVQYELSALPPEAFDDVAALRRQIEGTVREEVERGMALGVFDVTESALTARAVLSLGIDVARWWTPRSRHAPEAIAERYVALVLAMLGVRTPEDRRQP